MALSIGVVGTGYVGLVTGTCFAATGNKVYCVDIDEKKIEMMKSGKSPIYEPGLEHLMVRNIKEERLEFVTDIKIALDNCEIIFLCLPTPPNEDGSADLHHVKEVAKEIAEYYKQNNITEKRIVVNKSTVPVGTAFEVRSIFDKVMPNHSVEIVSNPEFLREGFAVEDAMKPERVVVGTKSAYVEEVMRDLYKPFLRSGNPIFFMDEKSAEVTKYAANSFLAVKISFMNDLSRYCEAVGADIEKIRLGIGSDTRIGKRFLFAGIGYGGSCFPKDVRALLYSAKEHNTPLRIIEAAQEVNRMQSERFFELIYNRFAGNLKGKKIALWGLAFKPNTDDTREAPAFTLIKNLLNKDAVVTAFDPEAMGNTKLRFGDKIKYAESMYETLKDAEALIIATEWNEFRNPDFDKIKSMLKNPLLFDGRNLFQPEDMHEIGMEYHCIGRKMS